jgi:hypothetical protein
MSDEGTARLNERLLAILDEGITPVTADEARVRAGSTDPPALTRRSTRRSRHRISLVLAVAFALALIVGVVAVVSVEGRGHGVGSTTATAGSQRPILHASLARRLNLPSDMKYPSFLAVQGDIAWVGTAGSGNGQISLIDRINLNTGRVEVQSSVTGAPSSVSVSGDDLWLTEFSDHSSTGSLKLLNASSLRVESVVPVDGLIAVSATKDGAFVAFSNPAGDAVQIGRVEGGKLQTLASIASSLDASAPDGFEACGSQALIAVDSMTNPTKERIEELSLVSGHVEQVWNLLDSGLTYVDCNASAPGLVIDSTGLFELGPFGQVTELSGSPVYGQGLAESSDGVLWTATQEGSSPRLSKLVLYGDSTGVSAPVSITLGPFTLFSNAGPVADGNNVWLCADGGLLQVVVSESTNRPA